MLDLIIRLIIMGGAVGLYLFLYRFIVALTAQSSGSVLSVSHEETPLGINPHGSFLEKLDYFLARRLPLERKLKELHTRLGQPESPTPLDMLHYKEWAFAGTALAVWLMTESLFLGLIAGVLGFLFPDLLYQEKVQRRQQEILRNFPTFVDLAALTIESGLDYMNAIERILKMARQKTELERELSKMINEVQLGYSRREALIHMAERTGLQEVRSFVGLIIQSDELGTSLVDLLRNFGSDLRFRRLNKAEKLAAQASTKMLFPLFIFIFPTVFILMLAPMIRELMRGGLPF